MRRPVKSAGRIRSLTVVRVSTAVESPVTAGQTGGGLVLLKIHQRLADGVVFRVRSVSASAASSGRRPGFGGVGSSATVSASAASSTLAASRVRRRQLVAEVQRGEAVWDNLFLKGDLWVLFCRRSSFWERATPVYLYHTQAIKDSRVVSSSVAAAAEARPDDKLLLHQRLRISIVLIFCSPPTKCKNVCKQDVDDWVNNTIDADDDDIAASMKTIWSTEAVLLLTLTLLRDGRDTLAQTRSRRLLFNCFFRRRNERKKTEIEKTNCRRRYRLKSQKSSIYFCKELNGRTRRVTERTADNELKKSFFLEKERFFGAAVVRRS